MNPRSILDGANIIMSDELRDQLDESSLFVDEVIAQQREKRLLPRFELAFSGSSVMHSFECVDTQCMRSPGALFFDEWHVTILVNDAFILAQAMKCKFDGLAQIVVGNEAIHSFDLNERIISVAVGQAIDGVSVTYVFTSV